MKSVAKTIEGKVFVWALPKDASYEDMTDGPFKYEISQSSSYHWKTGAVMIHEQDVVVNVPAGIDLISKAFETLEAAKVEAQVEYNKKIMEIDKQIQGLLMLTHQPDGGDIESYDVEGNYMGDGLVGELVDDYRGADHE